MLSKLMSSPGWFQCLVNVKQIDVLTRMVSQCLVNVKQIDVLTRMVSQCLVNVKQIDVLTRMVSVFSKC